MAWASKQKVILGCLAFATWCVLVLFPAVPVLPIGRSAGSLVGAVLMVVFEVLSPTEAFNSLNLPILGQKFGSMILTIYLERADLHMHLQTALSWRTWGRKDFLCRLCLLAAISSALFTNDTTCLILTQFVLKFCRDRDMPPLPFLIALATSSNIGSAATSIGNPQNLVIASQSNNIAFGAFLKGLLPAVMAGLAANTLGLLAVYWRLLSETSSSPNPEEPWVANIELQDDVQEVRLNATESTLLPSTSTEPPIDPRANSSRQHQLLQAWRLLKLQRRRMWKSCVYLVTLGMLGALLAGLSVPWTAITVAVLLMVLDFQDSSPTLDKVPYSLLVLFSGMFITIEGFNNTGTPTQLWNVVEPYAHINTASGVTVLSLIVTVMSNVASNVPTVLLLGPKLAASAAGIGVSVKKAWFILAWVSTVAGNWTLVGSAANFIVCEQARHARGTTPYDLTFWNHLWFGFPSTIVVIAVGLPLIHG